MDSERGGHFRLLPALLVLPERGTYQACHNLCERQRISVAEDHFMIYYSLLVICPLNIYIPKPEIIERGIIIQFHVSGHRKQFFLAKVDIVNQPSVRSKVLFL
jgi:hypothetical protein